MKNYTHIYPIIFFAMNYRHVFFFTIKHLFFSIRYKIEWYWFKVIKIMHYYSCDNA